jgi:hypothetical protein
MRSEVLMAVKMLRSFFWDLRTQGISGIYQYYGDESMALLPRTTTSDMRNRYVTIVVSD